MNSLSSNKKILITVGVFIVIIAVLIGVLKLADNNSEKEEAETTTIPVYSVEEVSEEDTSHVEFTTSPAMNSNVSSAVADAITAYMMGQYYIDGSMYSGGTVTDMNIAISGKDFYTSSEIEGMDVSILYKNSKIYFINNDTKQYIELSDVLMDQVDVDLSELEDLTEYLSLTQYNFTEYEQYTGEVDGYTADCYKYYNDEMSVVFYFIGDELKQIDMGDGSGNAASTITVNEFSPEVPAGTMSLSGLTKTNMFGFFGDSIF